jgi:hypothetical protein
MQTPNPIKAILVFSIRILSGIFLPIGTFFLLISLVVILTPFSLASITTSNVLLYGILIIVFFVIPFFILGLSKSTKNRDAERQSGKERPNVFVKDRLGRWTTVVLLMIVGCLPAAYFLLLILSVSS